MWAVWIVDIFMIPSCDGAVKSSEDMPTSNSHFPHENPPSTKELPWKIASELPRDPEYGHGEGHASRSLTEPGAVRERCVEYGPQKRAQSEFRTNDYGRGDKIGHKVASARKNRKTNKFSSFSANIRALAARCGLQLLMRNKTTQRCAG